VGVRVPSSAQKPFGEVLMFFEGEVSLSKKHALSTKREYLWI